MTGFKQLISGSEKVLADLDKIVKEGSAGLVFIDERLVSDRVNRRLQVIDKHWGGTIVILPEPLIKRAGEERKDFASQLITRVLGYQVKLS